MSCTRPDACSSVDYCSVISSQNFVGRYRGQDNGTYPADWEAAFSLCRGDDSA